MEPSLVYVPTSLPDMDILDDYQSDTHTENAARKTNAKEVIVEDSDFDDNEMTDPKNNAQVLDDNSGNSEAGETGKDDDDESDVELLEIQTYEEAPSQKSKTARKLSKAASAKQRRDAAKEEKAAREAKLAEEKKERRRKMLNFDDQEILDIDSDDGDEEQQEDIFDTADGNDHAQELERASIIPADKYCPIPIIIQTDNYPYLLAPVAPDKHAELLKEYDDNIVTLLDEALMPAYSLSQVFEKIKETFKDLDNPFGEENEVVVRFKEFNMSIPETCLHAQEVLLCEIYEAFNTLCKAKGPDAPKSLCLELSEQKSFVTKLEEIRKLAERESELTNIVDVYPRIEEFQREEVKSKNTALEDIVVGEEIVTEVSEQGSLSTEKTPTSDEEKEEDIEEKKNGKPDEEKDTVQTMKKDQEKNEEKEEKETAFAEKKEDEDLLLEETPEGITTSGDLQVDTTMTYIPVTIPEIFQAVEIVETETTVTVTETDNTSVDITKETSVPGDELDQPDDDKSERSHAEEFADALGSTKRLLSEADDTQGPDNKRQKE